MLVLAYDYPDTAGTIVSSIMSSERKRIEAPQVQHKVPPHVDDDPSQRARLPELASGVQKACANYLASGSSKRVLLDNSTGPLIVTNGARIPSALSGFVPTAGAEVGGRVGRKCEGGVWTAAAGGRGSVEVKAPCVGATSEGPDEPVQGSYIGVVTIGRGFAGQARGGGVVGDRAAEPA